MISPDSFLGVFNPHVKLSPESTKSEPSGQHKAGLQLLSHGTHAHIPFGHMDEVEDNKCKA